MKLIFALEVIGPGPIKTILWFCSKVLILVLESGKLIFSDDMAFLHKVPVSLHNPR